MSAALPCLFVYRRTYAQCCNVCYPLFLFIILAACVMACAGLVWMQIALKEDLDALKEKLQSSKSPVSHTDLVTLIKILITFYCHGRVLSSAVNATFCFVTVESSQKASSTEIPKLSEDLKNKERKLDDIENGDIGLNKLWSNLTEINRKVRRVVAKKSALGCKQVFKVNHIRSFVVFTAVKYKVHVYTV